MMHDQMKLIETITMNVKTIHAETDKIKFENLLQKKINGVEYFSKILIQQEHEFLKVLQAQSKLFKKLKICAKSNEQNEKTKGGAAGKYELQSLLDESDSSDEESKKNQDDDELDEDDSDEDDETAGRTDMTELIDLGDDDASDLLDLDQV